MKNYTIEVREIIEKPKEKEQTKSTSFSWGILLLAIITTFILFPESVNTVNEYYPLRENENTTTL